MKRVRWAITLMATTALGLFVPTEPVLGQVIYQNVVQDWSFEQQTGNISYPWQVEGGSSAVGIDVNTAGAVTGTKSAWIGAATGWHAITQRITGLNPTGRYRFEGWVRVSDGVTDGYFGVRYTSNGATYGIAKETVFGRSIPPNQVYKKLSVDFYAGGYVPNEITIFIGLWGPGTPEVVHIDELTVREIDPSMILVDDGGFENQTGFIIKHPWESEGAGLKGVDRSLGYSRTGANNAFIRTSSGWNALKQKIATTPGKAYVAYASIRTSSNVSAGYFGIRDGTGTIVNQIHFGSLPEYMTLMFAFTGTPQYVDPYMTIFVGYDAPGVDSWIQVDNIAILPAVSCQWCGPGPNPNTPTIPIPPL